MVLGTSYSVYKYILWHIYLFQFSIMFWNFICYSSYHFILFVQQFLGDFFLSTSTVLLFFYFPLSWMSRFFGSLFRPHWWPFRLLPQEQFTFWITRIICQKGYYQDFRHAWVGHGQRKAGDHCSNSLISPCSNLSLQIRAFPQVPSRGVVSSSQASLFFSDGLSLQSWISEGRDVSPFPPFSFWTK